MPSNVTNLAIGAVAVGGVWYMLKRQGGQEAVGGLAGIEALLASLTSQIASTVPAFGANTGVVTSNPGLRASTPFAQGTPRQQFQTTSPNAGTFEENVERVRVTREAAQEANPTAAGRIAEATRIATEQGRTLSERAKQILSSPFAIGAPLRQDTLG